jgi:hypothetical protein
MGDSAMMGRQTGDQSQLFFLFNLEERIPARHLLRRINPIVTRVLPPLRPMGRDAQGHGSGTRRIKGRRCRSGRHDKAETDGYLGNVG